MLAPWQGSASAFPLLPRLVPAHSTDPRPAPELGAPLPGACLPAPSARPFSSAPQSLCPALPPQGLATCTERKGFLGGGWGGGPGSAGGRSLGSLRQGVRVLPWGAWVHRLRGASVPHAFAHSDPQAALPPCAPPAPRVQLPAPVVRLLSLPKLQSPPPNLCLLCRTPILPSSLSSP